MRCELIEPVLHDFLNQTLSLGESNELEGHLAVCESCRREFHRLEKADHLLRETVLEMVSEIEVPPDLSLKIKKILAEEQKQRMGLKRLSRLLKTPAIAAVLLLTVASAGLLSVYNPFSPAVKQSQVVLSETAGGDAADGLTTSVAKQQSPPPETEKSVPENAGRSQETSVPAETASPMGQPAPSEEQVASPKRALVADSAIEQEDNVQELAVASRLPGKEDVQSGPAQVPQVAGTRPATSPSQKGGTLSDGGGGGGSVTGLVFQNGTLEESARGAGFIPARPGYLPPGAFLHEVSWLPGVVCQNYLNGSVSFTITQSRSSAEGLSETKQGGAGTVTDINGARAYLEETVPQTGKASSGGSATLRWQRGEWTYTIAGGLPGEEMIKIARSLK